MQPHYSPSSRENATPSRGTSPLACYQEVPPRGPNSPRYVGLHIFHWHVPHASVTRRTTNSLVSEYANDNIHLPINLFGFSASQFELVLKTLVSYFRTVKGSNWPLFATLYWLAHFLLARAARISHKMSNKKLSELKPARDAHDAI